VERAKSRNGYRPLLRRRHRKCRDPFLDGRAAGRQWYNDFPGPARDDFVVTGGYPILKVPALTAHRRRYSTVSEPSSCCCSRTYCSRTPSFHEKGFILPILYQSWIRSRMSRPSAIFGRRPTPPPSNNPPCLVVSPFWAPPFI